MPEVVLPVTLFAASVLALMCLFLAARVSRTRFKNRISLGDQGNADLLVCIRTHANFVEFVPIVLILMALIEATGGNATVLWGVAGVFILARIVHIIGMPMPAPNVFRVAGAAGTYTVIGGLALWGLAMAFV